MNRWLTTLFALSALLFGVALCGCMVLGGGAEGPDGGGGGGGADMAGGGGGGSTLPVRCSTILDNSDPHCAFPDVVPPGSIGSGPTVAAMPAGILNDGLIDPAGGGRVIAAYQWSSSSDGLLRGGLMAFDLQSGARTVVTGAYPGASGDPVQVGSGAETGPIFDVQAGADGWYLFAYTGLFRVDPQSGARTQVWDFTKQDCKVGGTAVQPERHGMALGPDGTIYLASSENPGGAGTGLLAIKGASCSALSWWDGPAGSARGGGPSSPSGWEFAALRFKSGAIYANEWLSQSLLRFDPSSGDRTAVSSTSDSFATGSGPGLYANGGLAFASDPDLVWEAGSPPQNELGLATVSLTTGARVPIELQRGPATLGSTPDRPVVWVHPSKPLLIAAVSGGLAFVEPSTGESYLFSY